MSLARQCSIAPPENCAQLSVARRRASKDAAEGSAERTGAVISNLEGGRRHRRPLTYASQRANPQWKAFEESPEVLVTFLGPNKHVSPSWYGTHPRAPSSSASARRWSRRDRPGTSIPLTQDQLDAQYNIRAMVPDYPEIFKSWADRSARAREALKGRSKLDLGYGPDPAQKLALFLAKPGAPLLIFIHGGYWRAQDKSEFSYVAEPYVAAGLSVAVVNYRLALKVTIDEIVNDIRQSVAYLHKAAAEHGFDPDRIFISGTSAGGHLTVSGLATRWKEFGLPVDALKGGCALVVSTIWSPSASAVSRG